MPKDLLLANGREDVVPIPPVVEPAEAEDTLAIEIVQYEHASEVT